VGELQATVVLRKDVAERSMFGACHPDWHALLRRPRRLRATASAIRLTYNCTAGRGEAWQLIVNPKPEDLILRPDVVIDVHALRLIQATNGDLYTVSKHDLVHAECASARGAETALRKC
jgi:hypothetical protein